jgi:hypothetical protein
MTTYIILGLLCLLALVVIGREVSAMWGDWMGTGGTNEDAGSKVEKRKNERIRKEIEQWREGR